MSQYCIKINDVNPVAVVCGGKYDNKKISIVRDSSPDTDRDVLEQLDLSDFVDKYRLMDYNEQLDIIDQIKGNKPLIQKNNKYMQKFKTSCKNTLKLDTGNFWIYPAQNSERVYVSGQSGSGKSSVISMYMFEYKKMFPKRKIYLLSSHALKDEPAFKPHNITQIPLEKDIITALTYDKLKNSLVVFDDTDEMQDKKLQDVVNRFNSDLLANGRKYEIHIITASHQMMNYKRTRDILNECNRVVFFLNNAKYHIKRYLRVYAGLETKQIQRIVRLRSRWCCLGLTIPNYFISECECGLLDEDED